ncbi:MAG: FAD-binding protein [Microbacteriaceae bacterium]|nr:FAD-binding protein [Microbacteriaceae bacterium]
MTTNWSGNYTYRAARLHEPATLDELRAIVRDASALRVLGSRHSFNGIADSTGDQVSLAGLDPDIRIEADAATVSFSAGTRYGDLARVLRPAGWALHNLASLPHISVAGAVATATHGSGIALGNLSTAVLGLEILRADGELVALDRDSADFTGAVVGLGALGVVTRLTLAIEPTFDVAQTVFLGLDWDTVSRRFDEIMGAAYSVSLFTDWSDRGVQQVWVKSRGEAVTELAGAALATSPQHPILGAPADFATEQLGVPGPWDQRLPHFRLEFTPSSGEEIQTEYLLSRSSAPEAIAAVRAIQPLFADLLLVSEIRTIAADELWLSTAYQRDSLAFHFTWRRDQAAVDAVLPALEAALAPFAPRPHWGKVFASFAADYPRLGDFAELLDRWDPRGVFRNDFVRSLLTE